MESRRRGISHKVYKEGRLTELVTSRMNCLLKYVIKRKKEERIEVTAIRGRICKQLPEDLKEKRILEIERGSTRSHFTEN
jgi:hypothetical protein